MERKRFPTSSTLQRSIPQTQGLKGADSNMASSTCRRYGPMRSPDIVDRRLASTARCRDQSHCSVSCAFIAVPRLDIYCFAFEFGLSGGIHVAIVLDQLKPGHYEHLWQLITRWVGLYAPLAGWPRGHQLRCATVPRGHRGGLTASCDDAGEFGARCPYALPVRGRMSHHDLHHRGDSRSDPTLSA